MKKYNISKPKEYTDKKTGETKTQWQNIGTIVQFDNGNMLVEIPAISLTAQAFEIKQKEDKELDNINW